MEKTRSTMTLADLARRKVARQGPEFRTRLEFIRHLVDLKGMSDQSASGPSSSLQVMELDDSDEDDEDVECSSDNEEDEEDEDE